MRRPVRIGSIYYVDGLPWRVRLALWIAPELKKELADLGEQSRIFNILKTTMRDW